MRTVFTAGAAAIILARRSDSAMAEETTVIYRDQAPGIAVEHGEGVVEHRDTTTGSRRLRFKDRSQGGRLGQFQDHPQGCN